MELEFHELDRRLEHLRVRPDQQRRLFGSLAALGQQTLIVVVEVANQPNRYLVIDGYKRIAALAQIAGLAPWEFSDEASWSKFANACKIDLTRAHVSIPWLAGRHSVEFY